MNRRRSVSIRRERSSSIGSRRKVSVIPQSSSHRDHRSSQSTQRSSESSERSRPGDQNQAPVYCVVNNQPLIISTEEQPNLSKLTEKPVFLYHATGQTNNLPPQSNGASQQQCHYPNKYPLSNINLSNNGGGMSDGRSYAQDAGEEEKDFNIIPMNNTGSVGNVGNVGMDDSRDDKKELRRRKSARPWRGYVVEEQELVDRIFQSVAVTNYYVQEAISDGDTAINIHSGTDKLLTLHKKFINQRKLVDDGRALESREVVDENIPFNVPGETPGECECEDDQKKSGIHHHLFPKLAIPRCDHYSNNADMLYHYRLVITPETNFVTRDPTTIYYDGKDFVFEGYSIFSHVALDEIPSYTFTRNYIDYTVKLIRVNYIPEGFCIKDLDLVSDYLFNDIMELLEWQRESTEKNCCRRFHFMPRFVHQTQDLTLDVGKEVFELLSMAEIIQYLSDSLSPFTEKEVVKRWTHEDWKEFAREKHGTIISNLRNKPRSIRVDDVSSIGMSQSGGKNYPDVIHLTPKYKEGTKLDMKEYGNLCAKLTKAKRAVKSRAVPRSEDQKLVWTLQDKIQRLKEVRGATKWMDISFTSRKYVNTGIRWDICQHASYIPALTNYLHIMLCTSILERNMNYKFKDKSLLKVALTHPSHMDTASYSHFIWNMLQNLGKQYPHYERRRRRGPPKIGAKKKGVIYMTHLMANLYQKQETQSACRHNERLEFLGDAILDYLTSLHLFLMFPEKGPGKLTAFRSGIVQTENLSELAKKIGLHQYILLQHRVAEVNKTESYLGNALEAVFGAVFLDGGLCAVDNLLSFLLFIDDQPGKSSKKTSHLCKVWNFLKKHPLQEEHPDTDRHLIEKSDLLKKFVHLENQIGVEFRHIRILAKAFTQSVHGLYDQKLTGGNYERMEFLGDAILKYTASDYLYKHFPTHQEGHLTLLRSALVNSRCLAQASRELGLNNFIIYKSYKEASHMKEKVCSDVFEALLGALHIEKGVDKGILYCQKLVEVCILSRLKEFIINQEWLDPKSQLQQCCFSLRDPADPLKDGKDYFHPVYKRLKHVSEKGVFYFKVGVYVNGKKLGVGEGRNTKEAEKEAAKQALCNNYFEQYAEQKRIIFRKFGRSHGAEYESCSGEEEGAIGVPRKRFSSEDEDEDDSDDEDEDELEKNEDGTEVDKEIAEKTREAIPKIKKRKSKSSRSSTSKTKSSKEGGQPESRRRRKDSSHSKKSRSKSAEKTLGKRSRHRDQKSPTSKKRTKTNNGSDDDDSTGEIIESPTHGQKPQMEVSLERWIKDKNSRDDPSFRKKKANAITSKLGLEAISSEDEDEVLEVLEQITSSEDENEMVGDEMIEYEVISSSEFESDAEDKNSDSKDVKLENDEVLEDEMEKELRDISKRYGSVETPTDDELHDIELDDLEFLDDTHLGDKGVPVVVDDEDEDDESECEFEEVDAWEEEMGEPDPTVAMDTCETEAVSHVTEAVSQETEAVSQETEAASQETEAASQETEAASQETEAVSLETEAVSLETEAVSHETEAVSLETEAVSHETEAVPHETEAVPHEDVAISLNIEPVSIDTVSVSLETEAISPEEEGLSFEEEKEEGEETFATPPRPNVTLDTEAVSSDEDHTFLELVSDCSLSDAES